MNRSSESVFSVMASLSLVVLAFACITLAAAVPISVNPQLNLDATLSTTGLIKKYGYPAETHTVTTEDGYILELHRIPHSPKSPAGPKKTPVLLVHGLTSSSADWVVTGTENGFGYILADLGYDVWLANSRGNTYSKKHVTLDPSVKNGTFWDFSWHEMGIYDIPAVIDYVLAKTEQPNLFYAGHSQGTTQFYVMASERPEYNDKIRAMFSLAPVAYMSHAQSPALRVLATQNGTAKLENFLGTRSILQHSRLMLAIAEGGCADGEKTQILCEDFLFFLCGFDPAQMNATMLPVLIAHTPAGSSTKEFLHYAQEVVSGEFRQYDYGKKENLVRYGSETPPSYDLSKITAPVALHYASNDFLASPVDVEQLFEELANPLGKFLVPFPKFNHLDFLWAIDVKALVYDQVTDLMATL